MHALPEHFKVAAHDPAIILADGVRHAHPRAKPFLREVINERCLACRLADAVQRIVYLLARQFAAADKVFNCGKDVACAVRHRNHRISAAPVLFHVRAVREQIICLLAEHHRLVNGVFFLGKLNLCLSCDRSEALPLLMLGHRELFPALGDNAAVAIAAALCLDHVVFNVRTFGTCLCCAVRARLKRLCGRAAKLRADDVPVADVQLFFCAVGSEVIDATAHHKILITRVADQTADKVSAHKRVHMQFVCVHIRIAGNHFIDVCQTVIGIGAQGLAALFIVLDQHAERLHDGGTDNIGVALTVVRRIVIGNHLVPGRLDRIQPGADLLRKTCVNFFAHLIRSPFCLCVFLVYCAYINGSKKCFSCIDCTKQKTYASLGTKMTL